MRHQFEIKCHPDVPDNDIVMPSYATTQSTGLDVFARKSERTAFARIKGVFYLPPNDSAKIDTGLKITVPEGYSVLGIPKSGKGSKGLCLANIVALVDPDYQGRLFLMIWNRTSDDLKVDLNEALAQLIIVQTPRFGNIEANDKIRGEGGFDSTRT